MACGVNLERELEGTKVLRKISMLLECKVVLIALQAGLLIVVLLIKWYVHRHCSVIHIRTAMIMYVCNHSESSSLPANICSSGSPL